MLKEDPILDLPNERQPTQPSVEKDTTKSTIRHFQPVDLMPALLLRSQDWYRAYGWRSS
jgi:hypothetical protein